MAGQALLQVCVFAVTTLLISDPVFLDHAMPEGHPERPDRLRAIEKVLSLPAFDALKREKATIGDLSLAEFAHPAAHVREIAALAPEDGHAYLDGDTSMNPGSLPATIAALGSMHRAVQAVMRGEAKNAFLAARPPGHHAERETAMGFCFFNTVAVGARLAQSMGAQRIAIIDFDVHHGNGTQDIFWGDKDVLFISSHEMPLYPGTGAANERGEHNTILNLPLRAGDGGPAFAEAYRNRAFAAIRNHAPDLILISAGFDAHVRDPLGNLELEAKDYGWITEELMELAERHCKGRIVSTLEGGYDLQGLAGGVASHVHKLMGA
jgi:acetoin utilization deacetylase AcuC-like enzyme